MLHIIFVVLACIGGVVVALGGVLLLFSLLTKGTNPFN